MPRDGERDRSERPGGGEQPAAAAPAAATPPAAAVLAMQRSAGNAAVSRAIASPGAAGGPVVARSPMSWLRSRFGGGPRVSGPTNVRRMTPEEQGGVRSMNELIRQYEDTLARGRSTQEGPGIDDAAAEGVGVMVAEAERQADVIERFRATLEAGDPQGPGISDEAAEGVGSMVGGAERQAEEHDAQQGALGAVGTMFDAFDAVADALAEAERRLDEELYERCVELGARLDPATMQPGLRAQIGYQLLVIAVRAWRGSSRRSLNLPEDRARHQRLEALLVEKRWVVEAQQAGSATVQADPELKSSDATGYVIAAGVQLRKLRPDNTFSGETGSYGADATLTDLQALRVGSRDGYVIPDGADRWWVPASRVVIRRGGFTAVPGPLWPPDPEPAHVHQTTLGDCYLQAAVASLANRNPQLIKAMMRDNNDGTVTVRLHDVDETVPERHQFSARYVRINKSVPHDFNGNDVYNTGAMWVRLLEKAYTAGGYTGQGRATGPTRRYQDIADGFSRYAMEVLTGEQQQQMATASGPQLQADGSYATEGMSTGTQGGTYWRPMQAAQVPWAQAEVDAHTAAQGTGNYQNLLSFRILGNNAKVDSWIAFVKTDAIKNIFTARNTAAASGFAGQITLADFETVLAPQGDVGRTMLQWISDQQLYPGRLGSGQYSRSQLDMFNRIKETLDRGGVVTGGTHRYPGGAVAAGTGASGGEVQHEGMVGSHAYSFLATRSFSSTNPESPAAGDLFFVKIRNPWGAYSRQYNFSGAGATAAAVEGGDGVTWLELSDLTRYFHSVTFG